MSGNGHELSLSSIGDVDGRGAGIVFTYQATNGRYYSSTYGYFDRLTYVSSGSLGDVTNLSLFGTTNLSLSTYAGDVYDMMQVDAAGYLGSVSVATEPGFAASVPTQATPNSIAAIASSFVGQAWNMNGCWVLTSAIGAEAGASLPVQTTAIGIPGQASGEWIVAFNGPAGDTGNWQSIVHAGEMVVFGTLGGGGHITTCVSGSGSSAMLVDNITYVNAQGKITNPANDGSSADVIVATPHAATQEWAFAQPSLVVIYELDTPVVTTKVASLSLACMTSQSLAPLFTASDPAKRAITSWAGVQHHHRRQPVAERYPVRCSRRDVRRDSCIALLDLAARRRDADNRYAGSARLQRSLLGRLAVALCLTHGRAARASPTDAKPDLVRWQGDQSEAAGGDLH